jgi:hypothetical protein
MAVQAVHASMRVILVALDSILMLDLVLWLILTALIFHHKGLLVNRSNSHPLQRHGSVNGKQISLGHQNFPLACPPKTSFPMHGRGRKINENRCGATPVPNM